MATVQAITQFSCRESNGHYTHIPASNFWEHDIPFSGGRVARSNEHYFAASKTLDVDEQNRILEAPTPGAAKRLGRKVKIRPDWEEVKLDTMRKAIQLKFDTPDSPLGSWLVATAPFILIEGNEWKDRFWGKVLVGDEWKGRNWLGVLLMARRSWLIGEVETEALLPMPTYEELLNIGYRAAPF